MSLEGSQFGHYRLIRQIGSGGMGEIYLAEDTRIARQVAVKVVRNELSSYPDSAITQESIRLFQREMRAVASLDSPHILTLLDFGEETINRDVITYMVMPYRPEGSLNDWLSHRTEKLRVEEISNIIQQAADALQHAHDNGIIHQDVKPSNFLVRSRRDKPNQPDLLLTDFGIAKLLSATSTASQTSRGTATYMPPEQWDGNPVPATDQYALAIMAYLLLTGRTPFQGRMEQVMRQHFMNEPIPPSKLNPHIPSAVDTVLLVALAKKPEERFASISAFSNAFHNACSDRQDALAPSLEVKPFEKAPPPPPINGKDIHSTLLITPEEATNGSVRSLKLYNGNVVNVLIPSGTDNGQQIRLNGNGEPGFNGGYPGALILSVSIETPHSPSVQKSRRSKINVGVAIALGIALVIVILIVSVMSINRNTGSADTSQTLGRYCTALGSQQYSNAYNQLSAHYHSTHSEADFINIVPLVGCTYSNVHSTSDGGESATLYFSQGTNGSPETQTVTLVQENGTWKIDSVANS